MDEKVAHWNGARSIGLWCQVISNITHNDGQRRVRFDDRSTKRIERAARAEHFYNIKTNSFTRTVLTNLVSTL